jgi:hypothetical protein
MGDSEMGDSEMGDGRWEMGDRRSEMVKFFDTSPLIPLPGRGGEEKSKLKPGIGVRSPLDAV